MLSNTQFYAGVRRLLCLRCIACFAMQRLCAACFACVFDHISLALPRVAMPAFASLSLALLRCTMHASVI